MGALQRPLARRMGSLVTEKTNTVLVVIVLKHRQNKCNQMKIDVVSVPMSTYTLTKTFCLNNRLNYLSFFYMIAKHPELGKKC